MYKLEIFNIDELYKARTRGAKDKQPRRKRGAMHDTLTANGYEKSPISHPKVDFYHKSTGELVMVNKKTGSWSHYNNARGFTKEGVSQDDLKSHLATKNTHL